MAVSSDFGEMAKFGDIWLAPKQGTDAALAMAMGHVILKEFHLNNPSEYFQDYCRRLTDMPMLVTLKEDNGHYLPDYFLRASHLANHLNEENNPDWKTLVFDQNTGDIVAPKGSIGFRWGQQGKWNLKAERSDDQAIQAQLSLLGTHDEATPVAFEYFAATNEATAQELLVRKVPAKRITLADGSSVLVATVFDLLAANYGVDRGVPELASDTVATDYMQDIPYTPKWQEKHTGVKAEMVIQVAREFAQNAHDTHGKSMVIVGAGLTTWTCTTVASSIC